MFYESYRSGILRIEIARRPATTTAHDRVLREGNRAETTFKHIGGTSLRSLKCAGPGATSRRSNFALTGVDDAIGKGEARGLLPISRNSDVHEDARRQAVMWSSRTSRKGGVCCSRTRNTPKPRYFSPSMSSKTRSW